MALPFVMSADIIDSTEIAKCPFSVCVAVWTASDISSEEVDSLIFPLFSPRHPAICLSRGVAPACPSKALAAFSMVVRVMPLPAIKDAWLIMLSLVSVGSINVGVC